MRVSVESKQIKKTRMVACHSPFPPCGCCRSSSRNQAASPLTLMPMNRGNTIQQWGLCIQADMNKATTRDKAGHNRLDIDGNSQQGGCRPVIGTGPCIRRNTP